MAAYLSNVEVTLKGVQAGQTVYTRLEYHRETAVTDNSPFAIASYVYGSWWGYLKTLLTDAFQLLSIEVTTFDVVGGSDIRKNFVLDVTELGTAVGEAMPPNVTVRIVKYPDNTTKWPLEAENFKNGRVSFSGFPEAQQENGLLTPAAIGLWQDMADEIESLTVDVGSGAITWDLGLERYTSPITPPEKVTIAYCEVSQRVGTQNTRKR